MTFKISSAFVIVSSVVSLSIPVEAHEERSDRPESGSHQAAVTVSDLPAGHQPLVVGGLTYYFHAGVFYRAGVSGFDVVLAPPGARIAVLPHGHAPVVVGGGIYYYHFGTYYRHEPSADSYVVVESPLEQPLIDVIRLVSGDVLEGKFVSGDESTVHFEVSGKTHHIPLQQIVSIDVEAPRRLVIRAL